MNRIECIRGGFSEAQMRFLLTLVEERYNDLNNLVVLTDDEKYVARLLALALGVTTTIPE